jgi:capsular exopolysaccharide synthesis family protein
MPNPTSPSLANIQRQKSIMEILDRYYRILWSKKYFIIAITVIISILWFFVSKIVVEKRQKYTASAIIKFEDPRLSRGRDAVTDFAVEATEGQVAILHTRTFLKNVVNSLHLNIVLLTRGINRFDFFKDIQITQNAKMGLYKLVITPSVVNIYYSDKEQKIEDKKVQSIKLSRAENVRLNNQGLEVLMDYTILTQFEEIKFLYQLERYTVNDLNNSLESRLDRTGTILNISYSDKNRESAAVITNMIAKLYIDKLLEFKRFKTVSVLKSLEEQLTVARQELDKSEENLQKFRERNPYLLLSSAGTDIVTNLATDQSEFSTVDESVNRLSDFVKMNGTADFDEQNLKYFEITSFLESQKLPGTNMFTQQYSDLLAERNRLLADNYSPNHPQVLDVESRIKNLQKQVYYRAVQYLNELKQSKNNLQNKIYTNQNNIRKLPKGEIQLAELQRDRVVKESIYSNILIKYNEAKVSDAAIIPDAFIIEEAESPFVDAGLLSKLIRLAMGPLLGVLVSISVFVLLDILDDSVKNAEEVEAKLKLPVLATIPVILNEKGVPNSIDIDGQLDPKLITSDYAPSIAGEKVRLVRTKLFMGNNNEKNVVIISSLSPSEGKSLFSANLGITFAQQKIKTLLIDADLRRGVLHKSLNCNKKPGIVDFLVRSSKVDLHEFSKVIQNTHIPNLFLVPSGIQIPNPSELLGSDRMKELMAVLRKEFGMIIIDTPPMDFMPEVLILNSFIHNILLVVRYGITNLNRLQNKVSEYSEIKKDFCGVVINASHEDKVNHSYTYSYYHY